MIGERLRTVQCEDINFNGESLKQKNNKNVAMAVGFLALALVGSRLLPQVRLD